MAFLLMVFICAFLLVSQGSFAHAGSTDDFGGHTDNETGEYHYHHGYPAHQHTNGICPYEFDDRTGYRSGPSSSSSSKSYPQQNKDYEKIAEDLQDSLDRTTKELKSTKGTLSRYKAVMFILCVVLIILTASLTAKGKKCRKLQDSSDLSLLYFTDAQKAFEKLYAGRSSLDLAGAPRGSFISSDDRPIDPSFEDNSENTLYVFNPSSTGCKSYHRRGCKYARCPVDAYRIYTEFSQLTPCHSCKPSVPDYSWYDRCKKIEQTKKRYNILPQGCSDPENALIPTLPSGQI